MRTILALAMAGLTAALALGPARGQESAAGIIYSRYREFRIPFQIGQPQPRQLQLFVSSDQGRSWQPSAVAPPEQGAFRFSTERDGMFWFVVQALHADGKLFPSTLQGAEANLKVIVDTQPPSLNLQALPPRGNQVGVAWDVRDDNLDLSLPDAFRLEARPAGAVQWAPLAVNAGQNQCFWIPNTSGPVDVRLRARDRAGNWGEMSTQVSLNAPGAQQNWNPGGANIGSGNVGGGTFGSGQPQPNPETNTFAPLDRRLINSKKITFNYDLQDVGPSGISALEVWLTQDGRTWNKYPLPPGEGPSNKSVTIPVANEGVYGFTLVAKSGVGLSVRPPQYGDAPQIWVEVDTTKPAVAVLNITVGQGTDKGKLTITWNARDKNLKSQPISLFYAEQPAGSWTPLAQNVANTGRHVWTMPESVPYQFYVKVEAVDAAGNLGEAVTEAPVKVDLSQPKVKILTVEPAGK